MGTRVSLRPVAARDAEEFVVLARESADLHRGLVFAPTTRAEFAEYLARFDGVNAVGFVVLLNDTKRLAGFVNIRHITRNSVPSGTLGYAGFTATSGHGYVAEAVRVAIRYAFDELGLERLDAVIQMVNKVSRRVVEQAGFRPAGTAPEAIRIAGEWRDHERWTIDTIDFVKKFKNLEICICQPKR
jgi:ribosomal-protein-alanine N-acetyltransferase